MTLRSRRRAVVFASLILLACGESRTLAPAAGGPVLAAVSGDGQPAKTGQELPESLVVRVTDAQGNGIAGMPVAWAVTSGDGVLNHVWSSCPSGSGIGDAASVITATNVDGFSQIALMPLWFGRVTVHAAIHVPSVPSVSFTIDATDPGASLEIVSGNNQQRRAEVVPTSGEPLVVRVKDGQGNPVPHVRVSWSIPSLLEGDLDGSGAECAVSDAGLERVVTRTAGGPSDGTGYGVTAVTYRPAAPGNAAVIATVEGVGEPATFDVEVTALAFHLKPGDPDWFPTTYFIGPKSANEAAVPVGTTIEWVNFTPDARIVSTVVPPGGKPFDSGPLREQETFQFVPDVAGTWQFMDQVSGATGVITAESPDGTDLPSGTLEVTTSTTGVDIAPGYMVRVDAAGMHRIGASTTISLADLTPGEYQVELSSVGSNCVVAGDNPRTVTVTADDTVLTSFSVACQAIVPLVNRIAFESNRYGNPDVYVMNADGTGAISLSNHTAYDGVPAISPDGKRILFESRRDGDVEIYVMNADGTGQINLTNEAGGWDERPSWSPDGTKILFSSDRGGDVDVYIMNADGTNPVNLTNTLGRDRPAAWSPDGSKIAVATDRTGDFEIFLMNADGSNPVNLTRSPQTVDFAPAWSPDGTRIAFTSNTGGGPNTGDIHVMNLDGSGRINLTNSLGANNRWPSWSPDGSRIAFTSTRTGSYQVFVMNPDGTGVTRLSTSGTDDVAGWPQAWSPQSPALGHQALRGNVPARGMSP